MVVAATAIALAAVGYQLYQDSTPSGQAARVVVDQANAVSTVLADSGRYDTASALGWEASGARAGVGPVSEQVLVAKGRVREGGVTLVVRIAATVQGDEFQGSAIVDRCYRYVVHPTVVPPTPVQVPCPHGVPLTFTTAPPTTMPN